jgi:hypothetical protein
MPALVAGIHAFAADERCSLPWKKKNQGVDARDKPGHDDF